MTVTITKDLTKNLARWARDMEKKIVLVGVPAENAGREPEPGQERDPINNAEIGYLMEFGSPEQNIPARPHLVPGVAGVETRIASVMKAGAKTSLVKALGGDTAPLDETLNKVGLIAVSAVKNKITSGPFQPLSPKTIAARKRRGVTRENPLVDTAGYLNSITYVIRTGNKDK